ncbi:radical SAM family heme chaperone HemW [Neolewinella aurantiaca]|uniref:Heme chaperone HemW n=1 Tax=Neolewinella aurantiaca TaxID=2602767 RepID=A0A5C7FEG7_9BACT|nr:radical SAM family heme chaperone HemW [Neolewinella aurantiaca]TXF89512.1 radical SAM family heme chaperone HemW [Neolewinella aurantiaca]
MLYLHIPFCKQACSYCNFHFSTSMKTRDAVIDGIRKELQMRRPELPSGPVSSVYFGGGTPSLLTAEELERIFTVLRNEGYLADTPPHKDTPNFPEITLEANPDDLSEANIQVLANSPVNRLSIGIQSFFEEDLRFMNRAHSADEARAAVEKVGRAGFDDVSIDLIYGGQTTSDEMWAENLRIATDLGVNHISAYALTVEPRTALGVRVAKGKVADTDDAKFDRHFNMLVDHLTAHGYRHYEVSNFCLPGHESRHNSGYWSGQPYLGIGPGAHGFDGLRTRKWNVSNNAAYAKAWAEIHSPEDYAAADGFLYDSESLTDHDRYNEYIMTGLRRDIGVSVSDLERLFGKEKARYFVDSQQGNVDAGLFQDSSEGIYRLSRAGIMRADGVGGDGFWV